MWRVHVICASATAHSYQCHCTLLQPHHSSWPTIVACCCFCHYGLRSMVGLCFFPLLLLPFSPGGFEKGKGEVDWRCVRCQCCGSLGSLGFGASVSLFPKFWRLTAFWTGFVWWCRLILCLVGALVTDLQGPGVQGYEGPGVLCFSSSYLESKVRPGGSSAQVCAALMGLAG